MTITIDRQALRLLEALHAGCHVELVETSDPKWSIAPRYSGPAPRREDDYSEPTISEILGEHRGTGTPERIDRWNEKAGYAALRDGVVLIRNGLAVRQRKTLAITSKGRSIAQATFGDGAEIDGGEVTTPQTEPAPKFKVTETPVRVQILDQIEADDRLILTRTRTSVLFTVTSGERKLSGSLPIAGARAAVSFLADAGKASAEVKATFGDMTFTLHHAARPLEIAVAGSWDQATIALATPLHRVFRDTLREIIKTDGCDSKLEPVKVRWLSFDAVDIDWDEDDEIPGGS